MRPARIFWIGFATIFLAFGIEALFVHRLIPDEDLPWTPLDLAAPIGLFTQPKIAALAENPAACHRLLRQADIGFTPVAPMTERNGTCGWRDAVRLTGATKATPGKAPRARPTPRPRARAILTCPMAAAVDLWMDRIVQPAAQDLLGTKVTRIEDFGSYACRPIRGGQQGRMSQHASANAIDIAGFRLADGRRITIARNWQGGAEGVFLRRIRDGACRLFATTLPEVTFADYPAALLAHSPHAVAFDLDAALELHALVAVDAPHDSVLFYRECVLAVLLLKMPSFAKLMTLGRGRFIKRIRGDDYRDIRSVFREAHLLADPPSAADIAWWDTVQGRVRLNFDQERLVRARSAEALTIEYEKVKLIKFGIAREPVWMAIEDNTVGYDVLSFRPSEAGERNFLIEVKSTVASPLRFIITRNEWDNADQVGDAYVFHVWDMDKNPPILHIRTTDDIRPHIPGDNEKGKWKTAEIPVGV